MKWLIPESVWYVDVVSVVLELGPGGGEVDEGPLTRVPLLTVQEHVGTPHHYPPATIHMTRISRLPPPRPPPYVKAGVH
jgi:hypothetical protein